MIGEAGVMDIKVGADLKENIKDPAKLHAWGRVTAVIFLSFLLTSTGWLSWEYHLLDQMSGRMTDVCTMVVGYLLQACGIGIFAAVERYRNDLSRTVTLIAVSLHMICMVPAVLSPYPAGTLVFGFLMNICCGIIAGQYLLMLSSMIDERRSTIFGIAYAISIMSSWLLSVLFGGALYYSEKILIVCLLLSILVYMLIRSDNCKENGMPEVAPKPEEREEVRISKEKSARYYAPVYICAVVFLFSMVNNSGFAFPSADISGAVNVELSRLVYAAGLVIAGVISDRNRKYGAICALAALVIPFIIISLRGESVTSVVFWILNYFTFGFYSVYRIIIFSDIATKRKTMWLSGFGLMIGRIGDALGEGFCLALSSNLPVMIFCTAVFFAIAVIVFFKIYPILYIQADDRPSEKEKFYQYALQHDLSSRERDMLRLILEEKTNSEIAEVLCISENTVKFHAKNLFLKTGAKNRNELIADFYK